MYEIDQKISSFKIPTDDGTFSLDEKHCKYLVIFFFYLVLNKFHNFVDYLGACYFAMW